MSQAVERELPAFGGIQWDHVVHDPATLLSATRQRIENDPLMRQYVQRFPLTGEFAAGARQTVPEILARRMFWTLVLADSANIDLGHTTTQLAALAVMAESSIPYLWDALLFEMAVIGEMPPHIVGPQLPFPFIWFTFDRPVVLEGSEYPLEAILLIETDNALLAVLFALAGNQTKVKKSHVLPYGTPFHDAPAPWPALLSAVSFIESPYAIRAEQGLNHRERRNFGRGAADERPISEVISFVKLRRAKYEADSEAQKIEHKHRWLVRCHRRAQWYPSLQSHKIIWIRAHVKGPEDKPLKIAAYKVDR